MTRHFDAFLCKSVSVVRFASDEFGLYARGRSNEFGTPLAARGSRLAILAEFKRVQPGVEIPKVLHA